VTEVQRQGDIASALRGMLSRTGGIERYCSLTLSVRNDDMTDEEIQRATTFLEKFKSLGISEHIISVAERGDQENHLHLQSMISGEWCTRKCNTAEMKKVVNMEKIFSRSYNCAVVVHKLDENRSMESICGCDACVFLNVVTLTRVTFKWFEKRGIDMNVATY
jgi:hypothetical protein